MNIYHTYASGILNHIFLSGTIGKPATIAFGLTSTPPTQNSITEVTNAGAYARQALDPNSFPSTNNWDFPNILSGIVYNRVIVTFPVATAAWGYVSSAFLADSASYGGGNVLFYTTLTTPKDIGVNDQFYVPQSGAQCRFS